ncbi:MAG: hypothetical protein HYV28_19425 [Ignavibacteriales bacterium]|nr:hypothetical protein [Ignavibacteriales bacterium]
MKTLSLLLLLVFTIFFYSCKEDNPADSNKTTIELPKVTVNSPEESEMVADTLKMDIEASHSRGIKRVEFYLDNILVKSLGLQPFNYRFAYSTGSLPDSSEHTTFAKVYATDTTLITTTPTRKIIVIKLAPPTSLTTQMLESGSVLLQWIDKSKNETGFSIEKSTDEINYSQVAIAPANAQSIVLNGYLKTMRYLFRVRATRGNIIGSASQVVPAVYRTGIIIKSNPAGAQVSCNNRPLGVTPLIIDSVTSNSPLNFKLRNPFDSSYYQINYYPQYGRVDTLSHSFLVPNWTFTVQLYESSDPSPGHPAGLALSLGRALSYSYANKDSLDLYYFSDRVNIKYELRALPTSFSSRTAYFKKGGTLITDGTDSPVKDATWVTSFSDYDSNYYFVYDADHHYAKIQIVSRGGNGVTGNEAWVELQCIYNTIADIPSF